MGSGGLGFDAADVVSAARLNQKTLFVGTGAQINGLATTYAGMLAYCTSTGSGFTVDHFYQRDSTNTTWQDITVIRGSALTESAEQNTTPVADNNESAINSGDAVYMYYTIPNTYKYIIITGIEWKNGTAVAGNVMCGVDLVDANPPTVAPRNTVAVGVQVAQTGTSTVQRNSRIASQQIRAGGVLGVWIQSDTSTTPRFRYLNVTQSNNRSAISYSVDPPNGRTTSFSTDNQYYIKLYYVGYT